MGAKLSKRSGRFDEALLKPAGLYPQTHVDLKKLRKLILDRRIAPCFDGAEDASSDTEECPICFLNYPALNTATCCNQPICTECYLQVLHVISGPLERCVCPFCKSPALAVAFHGPRSSESRAHAQEEADAALRAKQAQAADAPAGSLREEVRRQQESLDQAVAAAAAARRPGRLLGLPQPLLAQHGVADGGAWHDADVDARLLHHGVPDTRRGSRRGGGEGGCAADERAAAATQSFSAGPEDAGRQARRESQRRSSAAAAPYRAASEPLDGPAVRPPPSPSAPAAASTRAPAAPATAPGPRQQQPGRVPLTEHLPPALLCTGGPGDPQLPELPYDMDVDEFLLIQGIWASLCNDAATTPPSDPLPGAPAGAPAGTPADAGGLASPTSQPGAGEAAAWGEVGAPPPPLRASQSLPAASEAPRDHARCGDGGEAPAAADGATQPAAGVAEDPARYADEAARYADEAARYADEAARFAAVDAAVVAAAAPCAGVGDYDEADARLRAAYAAHAAHDDAELQQRLQQADAAYLSSLQPAPPAP